MAQLELAQQKRLQGELLKNLESYGYASHATDTDQVCLVFGKNGAMHQYTFSQENGLLTPEALQRLQTLYAYTLVGESEGNSKRSGKPGINPNLLAALSTDDAALMINESRKMFPDQSHLLSNMSNDAYATSRNAHPETQMQDWEKSRETGKEAQSTALTDEENARLALYKKQLKKESAGETILINQTYKDGAPRFLLELQKRINERKETEWNSPPKSVTFDLSKGEKPSAVPAKAEPATKRKQKYYVPTEAEEAEALERALARQDEEVELLQARARQDTESANATPVVEEVSLELPQEIEVQVVKFDAQPAEKAEIPEVSAPVEEAAKKGIEQEANPSGEPEKVPEIPAAKPFKPTYPKIRFFSPSEEKELARLAKKQASMKKPVKEKVIANDSVKNAELSQAKQIFGEALFDLKEDRNFGILGLADELNARISAEHPVITGEQVKDWIFGRDYPRDAKVANALHDIFVAAGVPEEEKAKLRQSIDENYANDKEMAEKLKYDYIDRPDAQIVQGLRQQLDDAYAQTKKAIDEGAAPDSEDRLTYGDALMELRDFIELGTDKRLAEALNAQPAMRRHAGLPEDGFRPHDITDMIRGHYSLNDDVVGLLTRTLNDEQGALHKAYQTIRDLEPQKKAGLILGQ